jgi:hypothetical protein
LLLWELILSGHLILKEKLELVTSKKMSLSSGVANMRTRYNNLSPEHNISITQIRAPLSFIQLEGINAQLGGFLIIDGENG